MAIYHNRTKIISRQVKGKDGLPTRGKDGKPVARSVVAKASYRAGQNLRDDKKGIVQPYGNRAASVAHCEILVPQNAPSWLQGENLGGKDKEGRELRARLWNTIETVERRKDSQLAREFELALPKELDTEKQIELVRAWCKEEIVSKGFVADIAIHANDKNNPHCHVLCTLRPVDAAAPEGFGKKPDMSGKFTGRGQVGKGAKADLEDWRETWADAQNKALEAAGVEARVDHRTLEAQRIDRAPGVHVGVAAAAMERKGIETVKADRSMWAKMDNLIRYAVRGIERTGEVPQTGTGRTWWERAQVAIDWTTAQFSAFVRDESSGGRGVADTLAPAPAPETAPGATFWQDYIREREQENERGLPEPEMGFG